MGIINLTPDSFSDGGDFCSIEKVLNQVNLFVSNGVDVIDLGAQSTRPGAIEIGAKNESKRLIPYLKKLEVNIPIFLFLLIPLILRLHMMPFQMVLTGLMM